MAWFGWILIVAFVVLPLALLFYSVVSTSREVGRKVQPSVDSFFDFIATFWTYSKRRTFRIASTTRFEAEVKNPKPPDTQ